jgi:hypothetical protein
MEHTSNLEIFDLPTSTGNFILLFIGGHVWKRIKLMIEMVILFLLFYRHRK